MLSPHHRAIGLRAFASQKSKLPTQPEPPRPVCENRAMAICSRKSKVPVFPTARRGVGREMGRRRGKAAALPARKGGAAAAGTVGFSSSLSRGWGVVSRNAAAVGGSFPISVAFRWGPASAAEAVDGCVAAKVYLRERLDSIFRERRWPRCVRLPPSRAPWHSGGLSRCLSASSGV